VAAPGWKSACRWPPFERDAAAGILNGMEALAAQAGRVLLVDDDEAFLRVLGKALARRGFEVISATSAAAALEQADRHAPGYAVVDLKLGRDSGLDVIRALKQAVPGMVIVVLTGYASIATAVAAVKQGAANYLAKPVAADEVVRALVGQARLPTDPADYSPLPVERLEWEHIQKVLAEHDGNISATARSLGMHRRTLQRKLAKKPVSE
jgi:two-component system response regulator RegA